MNLFAFLSGTVLGFVAGWGIVTHTDTAVIQRHQDLCSRCRDAGAI